ncbi:MAG TPA: hypothetical protein VK645_19645 [Chitinophagaceae bacterium]|nr:hypothetical protein [Chitinophagaceae bacterium]
MEPAKKQRTEQKKGDCGGTAIATENHTKTALHTIEHNSHAGNLLSLEVAE